MTEVVDPLFEEAVEALRQDERARARDLLTRLLKANQQNVTYWIWMSAAVDTLKERVYCLETVLKLDPENEIAKSGLVLMGALPADKNVQPFSLNRARAWEDQLFLAHEAPRQTGLQAFMANPATRLAATVLSGAVLISALVLFGLSPRRGVFQSAPLLVIGASPTFTATPTFVNFNALQVSTPGVPTPLAVVLGISYTPTPLYVNTPRAPVSADVYRVAQAAYARGDWDTYVQEMQHVQELEPAAPDVQFEIAERYRLKGDCAKALYYYNESLKLNDGFAPGYLGLARARLCSEPGADVLALYQQALDADPGYGEVYLDRAEFLLGRKEPERALSDLQHAQQLLPNSALVQVGLAQVYLLQGNPIKARAAAQKAYSIDQTLLPAYFYLGRTYIENQAYEEAIHPLEVYLTYAPDDASAFSLLGEARAKTGDYREAVDALNQALRLDRNQVAAFVYLGTAYLRLGNPAGAEINFRRAIEYFPNSFEANIGLTEIYYKKGTFGTAYLQAETAYSKAESDAERAQSIYWRALAQEGRQSWKEAIKDWNTLLDMPASAVPAEMRSEAREHLRNIATPTRTAKPGVPSPTSTVTPTERPGKTATPPTVVKSPTPTRTPSPTKTP